MIEERHSRDDSLGRRGRGISKHPNLPQAIVLRIVIAHGVSENSEQRQLARAGALTARSELLEEDDQLSACRNVDSFGAERAG